MQINLKMEKMIDAKRKLVKMMKMHPENNLGGKRGRLKKEIINTGALNIIQVRGAGMVQW